jgi:hypothetical protein
LKRDRKREMGEERQEERDGRRETGRERRDDRGGRRGRERWEVRKMNKAYM